MCVFLLLARKSGVTEWILEGEPPPGLFFKIIFDLILARGRQVCRLEDNIKIVLREIRCGVDSSG
jgi:hypothetical protein